MASFPETYERLLAVYNSWMVCSQFGLKIRRGRAPSLDLPVTSIIYCRDFLRREAFNTPLEASCLICSSFRISLGSSPLKFHLSQILGTGLVPNENVVNSYMAFCFYIL